MLRQLLQFVISILLLSFSSMAYADVLNEAQQDAIQNNQDNTASQQRINLMDDARRQMLMDYRALLKENTQLQSYTAQLELLLADQHNNIQRYEKEIATAQTYERDVLPLLGRMVTVLGNFINGSVPFMLEQRLDNVEELQSLMYASDIGIAEKFMRLIDAYQEEIDYGNTIESYQDEIVLDEQNKTVNFLRMGRNVFIYQTLDRKAQAIWLMPEKRWQPLADEYAQSISRAMLVASKQAMPDIVILPLPAPLEIH